MRSNTFFSLIILLCSFGTTGAATVRISKSGSYISSVDVSPKNRMPSSKPGKELAPGAVASSKASSDWMAAHRMVEEKAYLTPVCLQLPINLYAQPSISAKVGT